MILIKKGTHEMIKKIFGHHHHLTLRLLIRH